MLRLPVTNAPARGFGILLGWALCAGVSAQTDAAATLERQSDEAFRQVLQQPQDLGLWSRYAQLLVQAGNYEGGIAALERLLLDPQASPDLRVDIAALYYRLGSYAIAETMVDQALADSRLQSEKRAFALRLKRDVQKRNQRSQVSGVVTFGLRHQSNPTFRSEEAQVLSAGVLGPLAADQRPDADNDISLGLRLNHLYDLDRQNSAAIVTNFSAYLVDYRSSHGSQLEVAGNKPYDLQVLDVNSGLQFKPLPVQVSGLTLRPHVILTDVVAQRHRYLRSQGLGLDVTWRPDERTLYVLTVDGQRRDFADRVDVPAAALLDGRTYGLRVRASREVASGQVLTGDYAMRRNRTERAFYDYDSHEARVTYSVTYASPIAGAGPWTTAVWFGALQRSYDAPDASVSVTEARKDREWRIGLSQTVPLAPLWSLVLVAEQVRNRANLPNFRFKNTSLSGTVIRTF